MGIKDFLQRGGRIPRAFGLDRTYSMPIDHLVDEDPKPPRNEPDRPIPDSAPPYEHLIPDDPPVDDTPPPDGE